MTGRVVAALAAWSFAASLAVAQQGREGAPQPFTLDDVLSAPFASALVAAPAGDRIAWVGYEEGVRNVWVAASPDWTARSLTRYEDDDGQELSGLAFTPDGRSVFYTRGGGSNDAGEIPNPTSDPAGADQAVWMVPFAGGVPRRVGSGAGAAPSPDGARVVWLYRDTLYVAMLRPALGRPRVLFRARGATTSPTWSPDGQLLAFVSRRGDHSFIGVYDIVENVIRWVAPAARRDDLPRWSPDGSRLAFVRRPGLLYSTGLPAPSATDPPPAPWSVVVANLGAGGVIEAYRAPATPDGAYPGLAGTWALLWPAADRLVFASEATGWLGLYAVSPAGGDPVRLTPTGCEVQDVVLGPDRSQLTYASNCEDIERRHIGRVSVTGGAATAITGGPGIEWSPAPLEGGALAVLRSSARRPASPALVEASGANRNLEGWPHSPRFPLEQLVEPVAATVRASDSVEVHLQVFVPPEGVGRHPAVLFFHGGPVRQMLLGWHPRGYYHNAYAFNQYMASRGFVVVSVNYRGGDGYGRAFREAPRRGRFGASEYLDVMAAVVYLRTRADVDTTRIGLWGGSYGGYLTALGLARDSDRFAAGFDLHGVHDYADEIGATRSWGVRDSTIQMFRRNSPVWDVDRWRSPVLLVHGDDDRNVEFQQTVDLARRLQLRGVEVQELIFPDEIHGFLRHDSWLRAYRAGAEFLAVRLRR